MKRAEEAGRNYQEAERKEDIAIMEYENEISEYFMENIQKNNSSYDNYIVLKGINGSSSEKKVLDAGIYEINYFGSTYTYLSGISQGQVFVNGECVFEEQGEEIYTLSVGAVDYACSGTKSTITLNERAEVYLKIDNGAYHSCGMITINKIDNISSKDIVLKGVKGSTSEKKVLDAGIYEINYFGVTFTYSAGISQGQVFVNGECVFEEQGEEIYTSSAEGTAYACSGIKSTITINETSEVYLKMDNGAYHSCGMITINKIKDI